MKCLHKIVPVYLFTLSLFLSFFAAPVEAKGTKSIEPGNYCIVSALNNKKAIDVSGRSIWNGAKVQLYDLNYSGAQRFVLEYKAGYYTIKNANSNKMLDVTGGTARNETKVTQWTANSGKNQKWEIIPAGNGYYYIKSALGEYYLDIQSGSSDNYTQVQIYQKNKTAAQKFKFISDIKYKYTTKTLKFNTVNEWMKAMNSARNSVFLNNKGMAWAGTDILAYKTINVVYTNGSGMRRTEKIKLPSKVRFKIHYHTYENNVWFDFTSLTNNVTCSCGYRYEVKWDVPYPNMENGRLVGGF